MKLLHIKFKHYQSTRHGAWHRILWAGEIGGRAGTLKYGESMAKKWLGLLWTGVWSVMQRGSSRRIERYIYSAGSFLPSPAARLGFRAQYGS